MQLLLASMKKEKKTCWNSKCKKKILSKLNTQKSEQIENVS